MSCWCDDYIQTGWCQCSILGRRNTTVTNEWDDIVVSSPFYDVVSPDNSITVMEVHNATTNTTRFEIFKACCPDKFVGACEADTSPWVLFNDKLRVDTSWPLTYNLVNCPWDAYVQIWFDASKLNTPDKKVAVDSSCAWQYLEDALDVNPLHSEYFEFTKNLCTLRLTPKPKELFYCDINSTNAVRFNWLTPNTQWFKVIAPNRTSAVASIPERLWVVNVGSDQTRAVTIGRSWWYNLSMWGSCVVGKGIHTLRHQLVINKANWTPEYPLLDDRFEWGWFRDWSLDQVIQLNELENVVSEIEQSDWVSLLWIEAALGRSLRWHWFWQSRTLYLEEWDQIAFYSKWNTVTRESNNPPMKYEYAYTARWNDNLTNWDGSGLFWSIAELPLWKLCN